MTPEDFRTRCILNGLTTVAQASRALGVSTRAIDRYRAGAQHIPVHIKKNLDLREDLRAAKTALARYARAADEEERRDE